MLSAVLTFQGLSDPLKKKSHFEESVPPCGGKTQQHIIGRKEEGRGLYEVMVTRCFGIIARKNCVPAIVIYHVHQLTGHRIRQTDRKET